MRNILLVLCSAFVFAHAGVRDLSPRDEQNALELYFRACAEGNGDRVIGGYSVYCKKARDDFHEVLTHQVNVPPTRQGQAQVIFIQVPKIRFQHRVQLQGSTGSQTPSKIYVLPQRASHQINANYNGGETPNVKPDVYFLRNKNFQEQQQHQYEQQQQQAPVPQSPNQEQLQYGPVPIPEQQQPYGPIANQEQIQLDPSPQTPPIHPPQAIHYGVPVQTPVQEVQQNLIGQVPLQEIQFGPTALVPVQDFQYGPGHIQVPVQELQYSPVPAQQFQYGVPTQAPIQQQIPVQQPQQLPHSAPVQAPPQQQNQQYASSSPSQNQTPIKVHHSVPVPTTAQKQNQHAPPSQEGYKYSSRARGPEQEQYGQGPPSLRSQGYKFTFRPRGPPQSQRPYRPAGPSGYQFSSPVMRF